MPSPIAFALSPSHLSIRRHSSINRRNHVLTARRRPERHNRAGVFYASALSRYLTRLQSGENLHEEAGAAITVLVDGLKDGSINEIEGGGLLSLMPPDKQSSKSISSVAAMLRSRMISPTIHLDIRKGKPHQKAAKPQLLDIRKSLAVRTIFNILGPLVHPIPADNVVLGVYQPSLIVPMANALCTLGTNNAMVVHCAGLDELAPIAPASVAYINGGKTTGQVHRVETNIAGIRKCSIDDLVGGSAEGNASVIRQVFDGADTPVADAILLNAAAGCVVSGLDKTLEAGIVRGRAAIKNGKAKNTLQKLMTVSTGTAAFVR